MFLSDTKIVNEAPEHYIKIVKKACLANKVIFIHIPKNAGTSIKKALRLNKLPCHLFANEIKHTIGPKEFRKNVRICVIRNPWDRLVSIYCQQCTKKRNKNHAITKINEIEDVYKALILGTRDYLLKNKFNKCLVSLSGGIDSAVVTAIAAKAIGSKNIVTVNLPSRYSSDHSITDSEKLCKNLGINLINLPIEDSHKSMEDSLNFIFKNTKKNVAEENLQARIRGNIIMTISNKFSLLVLSTGNKSEIATGYATLYGDMAGGFSVLKDVPKTMVYKLANYINKVSDNYTIPLNIINKPPSAELKPDQIDQDKLPKYEILDKIIELYVEKKQNIKDFF